MADDSLQEFVERNMGKILLVLVLILMALFGSVRTFLRRSLRRRSVSFLLPVALQELECIRDGFCNLQCATAQHSILRS